VGTAALGYRGELLAKAFQLRSAGRRYRRSADFA